MQRNQIKVKVILFIGKIAPNLKLNLKKWLLAAAGNMIDHHR